LDISRVIALRFPKTRRWIRLLSDPDPDVSQQTMVTQAFHFLMLSGQQRNSGMEKTT